MVIELNTGDPLWKTVGDKQIELELFDGATVADALAYLRSTYPEFGAALDAGGGVQLGVPFNFFVNRKLVKDRDLAQHKLKAGDRMHILAPIVGGGSGGVGCLPREFFARDSLIVARNLLGARLVRVLDGQRLSGVIVECEVYIGRDDTACHASRGRTLRNEVMFGPPGFAYVYFTYGIHWMLNVVTEDEGFPAAVLLRAIEPVDGIGTMRALRQAKGKPRRDQDLTSGPARLTQALAIDKTFYGADLTANGQLWLEPGDSIADSDVERGPRIGINYADERDRLAPWRFWVRDNVYVSR